MSAPSSKPEVVAFVHAKGQSTRVPGKNLRRLGDAPMLAHAIRNARSCALIDLVVIDSECDEILKVGQAYGARPLRRPAELASNAATGDDLAYWQASNYPHSRIVLQAVPTAPFIRPDTYGRAIQAIDQKDVDSVCAVFAEPMYQWRDGKPDYFRADGTIPNSFELPPVVFETTGLYVNRTQQVLRSKLRMNVRNCHPMPVSRLEAIDINTPEDFEFAEIVWRGLRQAGAEAR